ncbi:hypothetical protein C8R43DRAFT_1170439 [Mycena crocata]|nr:hypothetical protein C8R43DRAFT_1170439 [Mycena crocata]
MFPAKFPVETDLSFPREKIEKTANFFPQIIPGKKQDILWEKVGMSPSNSSCKQNNQSAEINQRSRKTNLISGRAKTTQIVYLPSKIRTEQIADPSTIRKQRGSQFPVSRTATNILGDLPEKNTTREALSVTGSAGRRLSVPPLDGSRGQRSKMRNNLIVSDKQSRTKWRTKRRDLQIPIKGKSSNTKHQRHSTKTFKSGSKMMSQLILLSVRFSVGSLRLQICKADPSIKSFKLNRQEMRPQFVILKVIKNVKKKNDPAPSSTKSSRGIWIILIGRIEGPIYIASQLASQKIWFCMEVSSRANTTLTDDQTQSYVTLPWSLLADYRLLQTRARESRTILSPFGTYQVRLCFFVPALAGSDDLTVEH